METTNNKTGSSSPEKLPSLEANLVLFFQKLKEAIKNNPSLVNQPEIIALCQQAAALFGFPQDDAGKKISFSRQPVVFLEKLINIIKEYFFLEEEIVHGQVPENLPQLVAELETLLNQQEIIQQLEEKFGLPPNQARQLVQSFIQQQIQLWQKELALPEEPSLPVLRSVISSVFKHTLAEQPADPRKPSSPSSVSPVKTQIERSPLPPNLKKQLINFAPSLPASFWAYFSQQQAAPFLASLIPSNHPQKEQLVRALTRALVASSPTINPFSFPSKTPQTKVFLSQVIKQISQVLELHQIPTPLPQIEKAVEQALALAPFPSQTPLPRTAEALVRLQNQPPSERTRVIKESLENFFFDQLVAGPHPLPVEKATKIAQVLTCLEQPPSQKPLSFAPEALGEIEIPLKLIPESIKKHLPPSLSKEKTLPFYQVISHLPPPVLNKLDLLWPLTTSTKEGLSLTARGVIEAIRLAGQNPEELSIALDQWDKIAPHLTPKEQQHPLVYSTQEKITLVRHLLPQFKKKRLLSRLFSFSRSLISPLNWSVRILTLNRFSSFSHLIQAGWLRFQTTPLGRAIVSWVRGVFGSWLKKTGSQLVKKLTGQLLKTSLRTVAQTLATALGISTAAATFGLSLVVALLPKLFGFLKKGFGFLKRQLKTLGLDLNLGIKSFLEKNLGLAGRLIGETVETGISFLLGLTASFSLPLAALITLPLIIIFLFTFLITSTIGSAFWVSEKEGVSSYLQQEIAALEKGVEPEGDHPASQLQRALQDCGVTQITAANFSLNTPLWDCLKQKGFSEEQLNKLYQSANYFGVLQCVGFKKAVEPNFPGGHDAAWFVDHGPKITGPPQVGDNAVWGPFSGCQPGDTCQDNIACCGHIGVITKIEGNILWVTQAWGDNGQINTIKVPKDKIDAIIRY